MKFKKGSKGTVVGYDLKIEEIINLLKVQIRMCFGFKTSENDKEYTGRFWLLKRTVQSGTQCVEFSDEIDASNSHIVSYDDILGKLQSELSQGKICEVIFDYAYFNKKQLLIEIIGKVKQQIIGGCVSLDYNDGMLVIENKPKNKLPNKLFFWETTGSLFVFDENGPNLKYQTPIDSIHRILL